MNNYHQWLAAPSYKEDIDYRFLDPASGKEYLVNIRMNSSEWLYTVTLSHDNCDSDGWYNDLTGYLRGSYGHEDLPILKIDIIRVLRERFPSVEGWNDDLHIANDKPIRVHYLSPLYPVEFFNLFDFDRSKDDSPFELMTLGDVRLLRRAPGFQQRVAIIGSRKSNEQGLDVAYMLGQYHSSEIVLSGLAPGINTAAIRGCLDAVGRTVAVIGTGRDRENTDLQNEIIEKGGLIISEHLIAQSSLLMALADKVVVVQCERESGTMHAVEYARQFRRPIFALDCDWSGNRFLIDNGIAKPFKI